MIGKLNHVAIAVPDLSAATALYRDTYGAKVSAPMDQTDQGVRMVFVELDNTKVELMEPIGDSSPIAGFLARNPSGGIHHLCYEVADMEAARLKLEKTGMRALGTGKPVIGSHGKPILFLHPKDNCGTLIELEEV